jgi:hypothetical protein
MAVSPTIKLLYPVLASLPDATLEARVDVATEWVKRALSRDLSSGTKTERISGRNHPTIWLRNTPVVSVESITVDGRELAASEYAWTADGRVTRAWKGFVRHMPGWNPGVENIVVEFESGGIPQVIQDDIIGAVTAWFLDSAEISSVVSSERIGDYQYVANTAFGAKVPSSVMSKLMPHMRKVS